MPDLPLILQRVADTDLATARGELLVPTARPVFQPWDGPLVDSFGGKDLLLVDGRPQFAEVAILRAFEEAGWQGRWLETYGKPRMKPALWMEWKAGGPKAQERVPITDAWVNERLHAIAAANGNSYGGCWDVVAWMDDLLVFAESKKARKDRMRDTQLRWLEAALACGCAVEDFLVVEWTLTRP